MLVVDTILILLTVWYTIAAKYHTTRKKHYDTIPATEERDDIGLVENAAKHGVSLEVPIAASDDGSNEGDCLSDLGLFIQSLSRLGGNHGGLSFGFESLGYQPQKNRKSILSGVTGTIDHGTLWGIMGASGAGKCKICIGGPPRLSVLMMFKATFLNVLMGKVKNTGGAITVNGARKDLSK